MDILEPLPIGLMIDDHSLSAWSNSYTFQTWIKGTTSAGNTIWTNHWLRLRADTYELKVSTQLRVHSAPTPIISWKHVKISDLSYSVFFLLSKIRLGLCTFCNLWWVFPKETCLLSEFSFTQDWVSWKNSEKWSWNQTSQTWLSFSFSVPSEL